MLTWQRQAGQGQVYAILLAALCQRKNDLRQQTASLDRIQGSRYGLGLTQAKRSGLRRTMWVSGAGVGAFGRGGSVERGTVRVSMCATLLLVFCAHHFCDQPIESRWGQQECRALPRRYESTPVASCRLPTLGRWSVHNSEAVCTGTRLNLQERLLCVCLATMCRPHLQARGLPCIERVSSCGWCAVD